MSQPIFLKSEEALLAYFKRFLKDKPKALQLGEVQTRVVAVFRFSIDGKRYKILGSTPRAIIQEFVAIAEEHGDASMALKVFEAQGGATLILSTHSKPDGWVCLPYAEKAKESLKAA
ncbi:MAG: hypothetical protein ACK5QT_06820 [Oligoflexia bacterium]|jgi:hypothetical protein